MTARRSVAVGRYHYVTVEGIEYRVYVEDNGVAEGIPLICQHTAGADGRQWRHLLEDADVAQEFRVIVPDLPYHGKSLPPEGVEWWTEEYRLTQKFFEAFVVALAHALELVDPVFIGSSMGGHLAPDLALNHPDRFRAVIGLEAAIQSHGDETMRFWQAHPRLSNRFRDAFMVTLCAPMSPQASRRETGWIYSQGAPTVLSGDLFYYFTDHDLTGRLHEIDTDRVAVYLLNGDYDFSAPPADGRLLADGIRGAHFVEMVGMGHFPMAENYPLFRTYLLPILAEIAGTGTALAPAARTGAVAS